MSMSQVVYMGPYLQFAKPIEVSELVGEVERLSQGRFTLVLGEDNKVVLIVANPKDYKELG